MSSKIGESGFKEEREKIASAFGTSTDPLAKFEDTFFELEEKNDVDVFEGFFVEVLGQDDLRDDTIGQYERTFDQWRKHMRTEGRHPACPNERHVMTFIDRERAPESEDGQGNSARYVKGKLRKLNRLYEYWQRGPFPHPTDYNPFEEGRAKRKKLLTPSEGKEFRRIELDELQAMVASIKQVRQRAIIGLQCKLGIRAGEAANIRIADFHITNTEVARHYPSLGTNPSIESYENAIYVPPGEDCEGNKSERPRVLPLDEESRKLLLDYLLIRPDAREPRLFLSKKTHSKIDKKVVNTEWKNAFHPEYAETEEYRDVTSHFGRHWFTTYWKIQENVPRELVQYMRGDKLGDGARYHSDAIDAYLHAYYEDIEELYRKNIYKLQL